jgi:hypothetical protein
MKKKKAKKQKSKARPKSRKEKGAEDLLEKGNYSRPMPPLSPAIET